MFVEKKEEKKGGCEVILRAFVVVKWTDCTTFSGPYV